MSATCMKRLVRERERLPTDNAEFFVNWKDENLRSFEAYIIGPDDSQYKHKFVKLKFDIPENYPLVSPKVKFIQHNGERIHPNLYKDGKVCLSILGTWHGQPWAYSMTIESILISIRSLLDNKPYEHEPNQRDHPAFNTYVQYNTWRWLLLDYLERERDPEARAFLQQYIQKHGSEMIRELESQKRANAYVNALSSPYHRGASQVPQYDRLLAELRAMAAKHTPSVTQTTLKPWCTSDDNKGRKRKDASSAKDDNHQPPNKKQNMGVIDLTDSP